MTRFSLRAAAVATFAAFGLSVVCAGAATAQIPPVPAPPIPPPPTVPVPVPPPPVPVPPVPPPPVPLPPVPVPPPPAPAPPVPPPPVPLPPPPVTPPPVHATARACARAGAEPAARSTGAQAARTGAYTSGAGSPAAGPPAQPVTPSLPVQPPAPAPAPSPSTPPSGSSQPAPSTGAGSTGAATDCPVRRPCNDRHGADAVPQQCRGAVERADRQGRASARSRALAHADSEPRRVADDDRLQLQPLAGGSARPRCARPWPGLRARRPDPDRRAEGPEPLRLRRHDPQQAAFARHLRARDDRERPRPSPGPQLSHDRCPRLTRGQAGAAEVHGRGQRRAATVHRSDRLSSGLRGHRPRSSDRHDEACRGEPERLRRNAVPAGKRPGRADSADERASRPARRSCHRSDHRVFSRWCCSCSSSGRLSLSPSRRCSTCRRRQHVP